MINAEQFNRIALAMPILQHAEASLINELRREAQFAKIPAGQDVFVEGDRVGTDKL